MAVDETPMLVPELMTPLIFRKRPADLPADLRPTWRIALLVLLLRNCCQQSRASLPRLHVLNWGLRSQETREQLLAAIERRLQPDGLIVRFEPFLNRAIDYAIGERLIDREKGTRYVLTQAGKRFADEVDAEPSLFREEKAFMSQIKTKVTETLVKQMFN